MQLVWRALLVCAGVLSFFQLGCQGYTADPAANASEIVNISPSAVAAGNSGFTLVVAGKNFSENSAIVLNGKTQSTMFVNSGQLTVQVSSEIVSQAAVIPVAVANANSGKVSNSVSLTVGKQLEVATTELPSGTTDVNYAAPVSATGGVPPYHWSVESGNLPGGLAMSSESGAISGTPTNPGDSTFTAWVTDSTNSSAKASLAINVSPAQKSSSGTAGSPGLYGPGIGGNSLANTTLGPYGNTVSYRFRAKHSGPVQQALVYLIPDHPGYAAGTGGTIQVTMHTDDGTEAHNPSSTVLGSYDITNVLSLPSPGRYFYTIKFAAPPTLVAGQLYHMVFRNLDASPTVNFLSVDALYEANPPTQFQPSIPNNDEAVLLGYYGANWSPRAGFTPIYELQFPNGVTEGMGYMEAWSGAPEPISIGHSIRETFTVSGSQQTVSSVSLRVARVSGNAPLTVRLENSSVALIEEGNVEASAIALTSSTSPAYYWTTYTFASPYTLIPGNTYHIVFEESSAGTYQTFPVRKGYAYGFSASTYYPDGHAEFEQNSVWAGWTQWGTANRTDGDLQFYFSTIQ